ncbi:MAG: exosortase [Verrucomicrobiota bacterium]
MAVETDEPGRLIVPSRGTLGFLLCAGVLVLLFAKPLVGVFKLAWSSDLHSHALLIPFLSIYLIWIRKPAIADISIQRAPVWAAGVSALALLPLAALWNQFRLGQLDLASADALFFGAIGFVTLLIGVGLWFFGSKIVGAVAFPVLMLFFIAPLPESVQGRIEHFFQTTSAYAALGLFRVAGIPVVFDRLIFNLPTITLEVAPECSGIRSSLVLFITSLVAGHLFLQSPWKRAVLTVLVIPLAIARNGFRIFVIGYLCVRVDPNLIHSWVHRQGGPLFFVLSLVPFFALLVWLRRSESGASVRSHRQPSSATLSR